MIAGLIALAAVTAVAAPASARLFRRHYYASWSYYPQYTYYYRAYYYKPYNDYEGYKYHYCIHYPTQPRYVYYYNPYSSQYWGRYDMEAKGYSLLAEKDRKKNLKDIPEEAFPKPAEMPAIPESTDGEKIPPIEPDDLPKGDAPKDVPAGAPK
jgi:hypothetical protein